MRYLFLRYFTTLSDDGKGDACSASSAMSTMRFLNFLRWCRHVQRQIILTKKQKKKKCSKKASKLKNNNNRRWRRKTQVNTTSDNTYIITVPNYIFCSMPSIREKVAQLQTPHRRIHNHSQHTSSRITCRNKPSPDSSAGQGVSADALTHWRVLLERWSSYVSQSRVCATEW